MKSVFVFCDCSKKLKKKESFKKIVFYRTSLANTQFFFISPFFLTVCLYRRVLHFKSMVAKKVLIW